MHSQSLVLNCQSERAPQFLDITDEVCRLVAGSTIRDGLVTVYSQDAATAVKINEHEPLLLEDLERLLDELDAGAPWGGSGNGTATREAVADVRPGRHRSLLGTSESIPLIDGRLQFGRWQRLFLIELKSPGQREVIVQILGV
ncbi:MAG TPA: secondary thiamine-phosphate synthase enzyme YjbQ [Dehalococcoidia bacterium]|nr:secondary thiamine-phosphate synthase enzyme YjbQ [Dehalococcoidia bacterium]